MSSDTATAVPSPQPTMKFEDVKLHTAGTHAAKNAPKDAARKTAAAKAAPRKPAAKASAAPKPAAKASAKTEPGSAWPDLGLGTFFNNWQKAMMEQLEETNKALGSTQANFADFQRAGDDFLKLAESSRQIAAEGLADIGHQVQEYAKRSFEDSWQTGKALLAAHSLPEAFEVQYGYCQTAFKAYTDWLRSLQAISVDLGQKALEPVTGCFEERLGSFFGEKAA